MQLLDAGIIAPFKNQYKKQVMQHPIDMDEMGLSDQCVCDLKQSMQWLHKAWDQVSQDAVANCWKHVKYVARYKQEEVLVLRMGNLQLE